MDRDIEGLRRALSENPEDIELRAQLLRARARGRDPDLTADCESVALALEALLVLAGRCSGLVERADWSRDSMIMLLRGFLDYERPRPRPPRAIQEAGREVLESHLKQRPLFLDPERLELPRLALPGPPFQLYQSFEVALAGLFPELFEEDPARKDLATRLRYLLWQASRLNNELSQSQGSWTFDFDNIIELSGRPELSEVRSGLQRRLFTIDPEALFDESTSRAPEREVDEALQHIDLTRAVVRPRLRLFPESGLAPPVWSFQARPGPWTPLLTRLLSRLARGPFVLYKQGPITLQGRLLDLNYMDTIEGWILLIACRR